MEASELLEIIARGEDSKHQFKAMVTNTNSLAKEMVAFCNSGGGQIFIGVNKDGSITGLSSKDIDDQKISDTATNSVRPPINPKTENVLLADGLVIVVNVLPIYGRIYTTRQAVIWVKNGSDKRKVTAIEEMQRMFQSASLVYGDKVPANGTSIADLDMDYFPVFFKTVREENLEKQDLPISQLLENMNLMKDGELNIAGALLLSKNNQFKLPAFVVKAVCYPGDEIGEDSFDDQQEYAGKIADVFYKSMGFILRNIHHRQFDQGVNSEGKPEIPKKVLEELLVNALIHRDYFISAPIRIFIFRNRIEIISPGYLPNNLTVENIKNGISNIRNQLLSSFATKILPYRGYGTGIIRSVRAYPDIDFEDDRDGNQFKVIIKRRSQ